MKVWTDQEIPPELEKVFAEVGRVLPVELVKDCPESENHFVFSDKGLSYQDKELGDLYLDFLNDTVNYSRKAHKGKNELIAKAVGLPKGIDDVFDATLGLAQDAWFLAQLGAQVRGCERSPVLYLLLADALRRAQQKIPHVRLQIFFSDSIQFLDGLEVKPAVIYVDPMFPEKKKSALPRKEMRIFRKLVGDDIDSEHLLEKSLQMARERVVVKRPLRAAALLAPKTKLPAVHTFEGKTVRYDLYSPKMERLL